MAHYIKYYYDSNHWRTPTIIENFLYIKYVIREKNYIMC